MDWHQRVLSVRRALKPAGKQPVFGSRKNDQEVAVAVHESVLELREQKAMQDAERAKYTEDWGLVFTATDGSPVDPTNFLDDVCYPVLATLVEPGQVVVISTPWGKREHLAVYGDPLWRPAPDAITEDDRRAADKAARLLAEALAYGEKVAGDRSGGVVRANVRAPGSAASSEAAR